MAKLEKTENAAKIAKLERQIKELEKTLSKSGFTGIVDRNSRKKNEDKLRKLSKELEKLKTDRKPAASKKNSKSK